MSASRSASLCSFTFADGRRCRTPRQPGHPLFCCFHARKQAQARAAEQLSRDVSFFFSGRYLSACDLSAALGRLFIATAQGQLLPKTARTLAYLGQVLVQSLPLAQKEYIQAFGPDCWRDIVYSHVTQKADYLAGRPAQTASQPPTAPSPPPAVISSAATPLPLPAPFARKNPPPPSASATGVSSSPVPVPPPPQSPATPQPTSAPRPDASSRIRPKLSARRTPPTRTPAAPLPPAPATPASSPSSPSAPQSPAHHPAAASPPSAASPSAPRDSAPSSDPCSTKPASLPSTPPASDATSSAPPPSAAPAHLLPGFGTPANWDVLIPARPKLGRRRRQFRPWYLPE